MADFLSHYLFGWEILPLMPKVAQKSINEYKSAFNWGLQGPDPLFFHSLILGGTLHKYGNMMHNEKIDSLFYVFSRCINKLCDERQFIAEAYFYGFLCHYALDSTLHPYVYYNQMKMKKQMPRLRDSSIHSRIESDIDYELYKAKYKKPATDFDVSKAYKTSGQEMAVMSVIFHIILKSVYNVDIKPNVIRSAFEQMYQTEKLLYSKNNTVYNSLKNIEKVLGKHSLTGHFKMHKPEWDSLNLNHEPWFNPWQPNVVRTESVPELFEKAGKQVSMLSAQYAGEFDAGWLLLHHFDEPFDNGNPKNKALKRLN